MQNKWKDRRRDRERSVLSTNRNLSWLSISSSPIPCVVVSTQFKAQPLWGENLLSHPSFCRRERELTAYLSKPVSVLTRVLLVLPRAVVSSPWHGLLGCAADANMAPSLHTDSISCPGGTWAVEAHLSMMEREIAACFRCCWSKNRFFFLINIHLWHTCAYYVCSPLLSASLDRRGAL